MKQKNLLVMILMASCSFGGHLFASMSPPFNIGPDDPIIIPLWENGAPGFEQQRDEPEQAKDYWVKNVHNPSLTVYRPATGQSNGAAVIICPGGGHNKLVITAEGVEAANYFTSIGVTAFVLKYRLFREENSPYSEEHARADGIRAIRLVRNKSKEFNLDPARIGIMGFSAGGELAAWTSFAAGAGNGNTQDPVEHMDASPDFTILIYPGPLAVEKSSSDKLPPAFMLAANDDKCCSAPILDLAQIYRESDVPIEIHLYAQGNHAFNMGNRSTLRSIKTWSDRLTDWMIDNHWLEYR